MKDLDGSVCQKKAVGSEQMDVITVFRYGFMDEEIYMVQLEFTFSKRFYSLKKSLRLWCQTLLNLPMRLGSELSQDRGRSWSIWLG